MEKKKTECTIKIPVQYWDLEGRLLAEYDPCKAEFERPTGV